jgi:SAM-dependent methyltransferase
MPSPEMRALVGPTDEASFDNPSGDYVYPYIPALDYESFFDFGCGCGRIARQLIQQRHPPRRYLGIDLHKGMVRWCQRNLQPLAPGFRFEHYDVFNPGFNPGKRKPAVLPLPASNQSFRFVNAWSVFTHLVESSAEFYIREVARIVHPEGCVHLTAFLFDKGPFPMMQANQNALYINPGDLTNAVIFDRSWFLGLTEHAGLTLTSAQPPSIRGFQWVLVFRPAQARAEAIQLPDDLAPLGLARPPISSRPAHLIR